MTPELMFRYAFEISLGIGLAFILVLFVMGLMGFFDK